MTFRGQEKKFRIQNKMDELKDRGKRAIADISDRRAEFLQKWEERSREFIDTFLIMFGRDGRIVSGGGTAATARGSGRLPLPGGGAAATGIW